ncbi:MAG: hypothetical protein AB1497_07620, partial [Bacillota bacterium]
MHVTDFPVIIGGDPFNQFRCLYKRELFWKLHDPEYCLSVMMAAYESGARAFDLSFPENVELFLELKRRVQEAPVAFGNPTWLQGVRLGRRMLQYSRDRVLKTLVLRYFPGPISELVPKFDTKRAFRVPWALKTAGRRRPELRSRRKRCATLVVHGLLI